MPGRLAIKGKLPEPQHLTLGMSRKKRSAVPFFSGIPVLGRAELRRCRVRGRSRIRPERPVIQIMRGGDFTPEAAAGDGRKPSERRCSGALCASPGTPEQDGHFRENYLALES